MRHAKRISRIPRKHIPRYAGDEVDTICGRYTPTGKVKCVDRTSPKADKIETIPIP